MKFITLTTDFGLQDESVGVVKGVIYGIHPESTIVDVCHSVESFDIEEGAWVMATALPYLPLAVHVGIVDPTVGTEREAVIIRAKRGDFLVGPNNGLLMPAARALGGIERAIEVENKEYFLKPTSHSFHGRDIFAHVAAWIARTEKIEEFGSPIGISRLANLDLEDYEVDRCGIRGNVVHVDRFGNAYTNIPLTALKDLGASHGLSCGSCTGGGR